MSNLGEQLRQIAERHKTSLEGLTRDTVFALGAKMVQRSPVDTGRFRNNWQFGLDAINRDTGAPGGGSEDEVIGRIQAGLASWKPGQTIYITNSLPYAQRLEDGWSKLKAPLGMVKVTLANFEDEFSRVLGEVKS